MTALGTEECLSPKLCPISCTATWEKNVSLKLSHQSKFNLEEIYAHSRAEGPILRVIKVNISCKPFINQKNRIIWEWRGKESPAAFFSSGMHVWASTPPGPSKDSQGNFFSPSWWEPDTNLRPSKHDEDEVHVKQSYTTESLVIKRSQKLTTCFALVLFTRQLKDFLCLSQKTLRSFHINASYSQSPPDLNILRRDDHFGELHIRRLFPNFERFLKGFPGQNFVQISRQRLLKDIQGRSLTRPLLRQSCQMMAHNPRGKDC